jgi:hypothetical protein
VIAQPKCNRAFAPEIRLRSPARRISLRAFFPYPVEVSLIPRLSHRPLLSTALAAALLLTSGAALADVPDAVWSALKERDVTVERQDGPPVTGKLIGIEKASVVVLAADGKPVVVNRAGVKDVRAAVAAPPSAPPPGAPPSTGGSGSAPPPGASPPPPPSAPPGEAPPAEPPAAKEPKPGYVGAMLRPLICVATCQGTLVSFGVEAGYKYAGAALRFAFKDGATFIIPDVRLFYEFKPLPQFLITPAFEFSPMVGLGGGATFVQITLRPALRFSYAIMPELVVFAEPLAFDFGVYTTASGGGFSGSSSQFVARYDIGLGAQYRF